MRAAGGGTISEPTYYEVLGVHEDATIEEIRAAWRPLVNNIHPDHETDPVAKAEAQRRTQLLNEANNTLKDPTQRKKYDNDLKRERGEQPDEDEAEHTGPDHTAASSTDEEEAAAWERMYQEAAAEAEEAWARWENPSASDRFAEGLAELRGWGLSKFSVMAPFDDLIEARWDMEASGQHKSLLLNLAMVTAVMAGLAAGQILFRAGIVLGGGLILTAMALALAGDVLFMLMGARPIRFITAKAGGAAALSEGDKLAAAATLALRAVWAGVAGYFAATIALLVVGWLYNVLVGVPALEVVTGYALVLLPLVWTAVAIGRWLSASLSGDSVSDESEQRAEHTEG